MRIFGISQHRGGTSSPRIMERAGEVLGMTKAMSSVHIFFENYCIKIGVLTKISQLGPSTNHKGYLLEESILFTW